MTQLRLAEPGEPSLTVREFCHKAARRIGAHGEDIVIELVQWGRLCDQLGRMPTIEEYATCYSTTPEDAEMRLAEFVSATGTSPHVLKDLQWDGIARHSRGGSMLDDVRLAA
jgi:hypothetical protein